jgi:hypothetical protein
VCASRSAFASRRAERIAGVVAERRRHRRRRKPWLSFVSAQATIHTVASRYTDKIMAQSDRS